MRFIYRAAVLGFLLAVFGAHAAQASTDRVSIGKDIVIAEDETAGDVVCVACSILIEGNVSGDVVSVLGGVHLSDMKHISGDVVALGGDVSLDDGSGVAGDLVVVGGDLNRATRATVQGDREVFPGRAWLFLPLAPFMILAGIIWLAIWLIRRRTYRFPMYPYGRGL